VSQVRWEPAEVWLNDGRPARFGWRGRLFTVLAVLERPPAEDEGTAPAGRGGPPAEDEAAPAGGGGPPAHGEAAAPTGQGAQPGHGQHAGPPSRRGQQPAWRCWRVSATPAKNVPPAAYRLCHDAQAGRWVLSRDAG
jgi:Family of unknown function (DUF6504)